MGKVKLLVIALFVAVLFIGCGAAGNKKSSSSGSSSSSSSGSSSSDISYGFKKSFYFKVKVTDSSSSSNLPIDGARVFCLRSGNGINFVNSTLRYTNSNGYTSTFEVETSNSGWLHSIECSVSATTYKTSPYIIMKLSNNSSYPSINWITIKKK